jgi:hypothetical protein
MINQLDIFRIAASKLNKHLTTDERVPFDFCQATGHKAPMIVEYILSASPQGSSRFHRLLAALCASGALPEKGLLLVDTRR